MTIRVGLFGCVLMARAHLPGYQAAGERAEIVMCCDNNEQLAQAHAQTIGGNVEVTTDWEKAIICDKMDAVDICSPHYLHAPNGAGCRQGWESTSCWKNRWR